MLRKYYSELLEHLVLMCLVNCKYLGSQLKPRSRSLIRRSSKKVNHPFGFCLKFSLNNEGEAEDKRSKWN